MIYSRFWIAIERISFFVLFNAKLNITHRWAVFGERKLQYYEEPLLDNEKVDALLASLQPTLPSVDIATPKDFLHSYARGNGEQV